MISYLDSIPPHFLPYNGIIEGIIPQSFSRGSSELIHALDFIINLLYIVIHITRSWVKFELFFLIYCPRMPN